MMHDSYADIAATPAADADIAAYYFAFLASLAPPC